MVTVLSVTVNVPSALTFPLTISAGDILSPYSVVNNALSAGLPLPSNNTLIFWPCGLIVLPFPKSRLLTFASSAELGYKRTVVVVLVVVSFISAYAICVIVAGFPAGVANFACFTVAPDTP